VGDTRGARWLGPGEPIDRTMHPANMQPVQSLERITITGGGGAHVIGVGGSC